MEYEIHENNRLYDIISELCLMSTEQQAITHMRNQFKPFETRDIRDWEINRILYLYKHFTVPSFMAGKIEVWLGKEHIHNLQLVENSNFPGITHCILDRDTDLTECSVRYNDKILHHYQAEGDGTYILELLLTDPKVENMRDPVNNVYYISNNEFHKPTVTQTDTTIRYECPYTGYIDFYMERDLVWCGFVTADAAVFIDDPMSKYTYGSFIINHDSDAEIDTRFYPSILPKVDGFLRVYDDLYLECPNPHATRLVNYFENIPDYNDLYHSDLLERIPTEPITDVITSDMTEDQIIDAFSRISAYCYRFWEAPPVHNENPVFTVLNNADEVAPDAFKSCVYHPTTDTSENAFVSAFPFEEYADVILYEGKIIYDYFTEDIAFRNGEAWVDHLYGVKRYVITGDYDVNKLTVIKVHTYENITVSNLEPWLDKKNLLHLHRKVNRFFHNFIALTSKDADIFEPEDQVWVGSDTPPTLDDHLWFELMGYIDNFILADTGKDIFPLVVSGEEPKMETYPSAWRQDVIHWIGEGTDISPEEVYNRILYVENELNEDYQKNLVMTPYKDGSSGFGGLLSSTNLQRVYWDQPQLEDVEHNDIWMEWYATIKDHISYSSENTLVMYINEHLYSIQFDEDMEDLRIIAFDDIVLNFRNWDRCVRYVSILADLEQSNLVAPEDMVIFYDRLMTSVDHFDPGLHRAKTHLSNVVAYAKTELPDFTVIFGKNILRERWSVAEDGAANNLISAGIIDYTDRTEFSYIPNRCLVFVNGIFISQENIEQRNDHRIAVLNFPQIIETVDIIYSRTDVPFMRLKHLTEVYLPDETWQKVTIGTETMTHTYLTEENYQGYYDLMRRDYFDNGKLYAILEQLDGEELEDFVTDFISQFAPITYQGVFGTDRSKRIIIPGYRTGNDPYRYKLFKKE